MLAKAVRGQEKERFNLLLPEIVASVHSLYADELKPFGRVLLRRLRERAAARAAVERGLAADAVDPETMPRIDPNNLRRKCGRCLEFRVDAEEGKEYSVALVGKACAFVDVSCSLDLYPEDVWSSFCEYIENLRESDMVLPGGRYACALELAKRQLPFLAGYSLGRVCHLVHLACTQRRILGYRDGALVPYLHSEASIKTQRASTQSQMDKEVMPAASWADVPGLFKQLLSLELPGEKDGVLICNIKRLFRSHFHLELSETALGHVRLLDLLCDPRLRDVCHLSVIAGGRTRVTLAPQPFGGVTRFMAPPGVFSPQASPIAGVTFVPVLAMPPQSGTQRQKLSILEALHMERDCLAECLSPGASPRQPVRSQGDFCKGQSRLSSASTASECSWSCTGEEVSVVDSPRSNTLDLEDVFQVTVKNTFVEVLGGGPTKIVAQRRSSSVPSRYWR